MKFLNRVLLSTALCLLSTTNYADELTIGKSAPAMASIAQRLHLQDEGISYQDWQGGDLTGKVRVIHHLNAALGVDEINKPFIDTVTALKLSPSEFSTLTVLNVSDVASFLRQMAKLQIEDLQRTHTDSEYVLDTQASVRTAWGLPSEGPSITLIDTEGKVLAHKDGKLEANEVQAFVALIQKNLP
ncbi:YtfJ family protein [Maricurvus nonylphenolicus]